MTRRTCRGARVCPWPGPRSRHLPRASCNRMGLVQRVHGAPCVAPRGDQGQAASAPHALPAAMGSEGCVKSDPPWPRVPRNRGRPTRLGAQGLGAGGRPRQPAWSVGGKQGSRARKSRVPVLALSRLAPR